MCIFKVHSVSQWPKLRHLVPYHNPNHAGHYLIYLPTLIYLLTYLEGMEG